MWVNTPILATGDRQLPRYLGLMLSVVSDQVERMSADGDLPLLFMSAGTLPFFRSEGF